VKEKGGVVQKNKKNKKSESGKKGKSAIVKGEERIKRRQVSTTLETAHKDWS